MQRKEPVNLPSHHDLWPLGRKPMESPDDGDFPTFTYFLPSPEFRTGQSVLVLPGGGYHRVSTPKEGIRPAQWLAAHGIATAVLEYRHHPQNFPVPLVDAQRAMQLLRFLARANDLDPMMTGVMGFSAGGHLAGLVATQSAHPSGEVDDAVGGEDANADFSILIYGVVTLCGPHANQASRDGLLGENATDAQRESFSIQNNISTDTPPFFITHGQKDDVVPVANALTLYEALHTANRPATMHLYEDLPHGIGMDANHSWTQRLLEWLQDQLRIRPEA